MKKKTIKKAKKVNSLAEIPALINGGNIPINTASQSETSPEPEPTNINNCEYRLTLNFNNEKFDCFTNNLKVSILSFVKEVHTEGFVKIVKGSAEFEKKLTLIQLRQLFKDEMTLNIFLDTFYSLYGQPSNIQLR